MAKLRLIIKINRVGMPSIVDTHWNRRRTWSVDNPRCVGSVRRSIKILVIQGCRGWSRISFNIEFSIGV